MKKLNSFKTELFNELKNFFLHNNGKLFTALLAISLILSILATTLSISSYIHPDSQLSIVDISINDEYPFPMIDIKLRNTKEKIVYMNKMEIIMIDYTILEPIYESENALYSRIEASYFYDVLLSSEKSQIFNISQAIPENDVDRFEICLATAPEYSEYPVICTFAIRLYYNEDNQYIESDYLTAVTNAVDYSTYTPSAFLEPATKNYEKLCKINSYQSIKSSKFKDLYKSYQKNKNDFL